MKTKHPNILFYNLSLFLYSVFIRDLLMFTKTGKQVKVTNKKQNENIQKTKNIWLLRPPMG